ncbi:MAG: urease subunit beta [Actinomycetota bacterium]
MRLTPTEEERLRVFAAAELARRTLASGLQLNAPEAIAVVCDAMHLAARSGSPYEDVLEAGRAALAPEQVMDGIADVATEIRLEVLLEEGSRLVVLREPFGPSSPDGPGAVHFAQGDVELVPDRVRITLSVMNTSERPVRVSSHYPFAETNAKLAFDRAAARGFRLDLPAGDSIRWAPGETKDIRLVAFGGEGGADA